MAINKVVYGNTTLIDLTDSTVTTSDLREGKIAYDKTGTRIVGAADMTITVTDFSGTVTNISGNDYMFVVSS